MTSTSRVGTERGTMTVFLLGLCIAILFVGYAYVWKKGALEWD